MAKLIQVAKDLNVGTATIVEFLESKGFEIENKPAAKLSDEMTMALTKEFQKSSDIKEQADSIVIGTRPKKENTPPTNKPAPVKEAEQQHIERPKITLQPRVVGKIDLESRLKPKAPEPVKPVEQPAVITPEPVVEEVKEKITPVEVSSPIVEPTPVKEPVTTTVIADAKPSVATTPPQQASKPSTVDPKTEVGEGGHIKTEAPELKGLKIVGKINIDKFSQRSDKKKGKDNKNKGQGSTDNNAPDDPNNPRKKRQRKVIKAQSSNSAELSEYGRKGKPPFNKDDANKPATPGQGQPKPATTSEGGNQGGGNQGAGNRNNNNNNQGGGNRNNNNNNNNNNNQGGGNRSNNNQGGGNRSNNNQGGGNRSNNNQGGGNRPGGNNNTSANNNRRGNDQPREITEKEVDEQIKATMARLSGEGKKKRQKMRRDNRDRIREKQELIDAENEITKLQVTEFITVSELASLMDVSATEVITTCMSVGIFVAINQRLDAEIIELVAEEFGHEVEFISLEDTDTTDETEKEDDPADLEHRAPIVTVMGHVDHGKTSLLDYIRSANVVSGEAGGITQHIGAYEVRTADGRQVTFLDTPGHEAFTAMRARGAKVTDIAIVIISADDSIMPQTREAISHAQAAGVPIVFAINKIDKDGANPDKIKQELAGMNLLVEEWGGKYQSQDISAKKGTNVDSLLEKILFEAELLELQANPNREALGTVLEASLDKGRGYVTKVLVQNGTLKVGDPIVSGEFSGKVKAMFNERGTKVSKAGPSAPVLVLGLNGAPQAGERFKAVDNDQDARQIASRRGQIIREQTNRATRRISLDEIGRRLALGNFKELNLIVKGDVDGSIEALSDSLIKLSIESVKVNVIHRAVGQIIESDVLLASASDAIVIGFQVRPSAAARRLSEKEGVQIKTYSIIYEAINEVKSAIEGLMEPTKEEEILGQADIREVFKVSKVGTVAGCMVTEGKILRNAHIRLIRDGIVVFPTKEGQFGEIESLRRFKEDVREVRSGFDCGISIKNFNDIKEGDVIECFEIKEVKQRLS